MICNLADMIAIPDFAAGAMENWGLITYRETALLYEPGASSDSNKKRVASVVSHELAHQVSLPIVLHYRYMTNMGSLDTSIKYPRA